MPLRAERALPAAWLAEACALCQALGRTERLLDRLATRLRAEAWRYDVPAAAPDAATERTHLREAETLRQIIEAEIAALQGR